MIAGLEVGHYRIPLPVVLSDSTHGEITHFELVTVRLAGRRRRGGRGLHVHGRRAAARRSARCSTRDLAPALAGRRTTTRIEALWQRMWWRLHYVGRGGPAVLRHLGGRRRALGPPGAARTGRPLWRLLGGHDPRVRAYAGGIDLQFPLERLLRQTEENLGEGLPGDQDEGRAPPARRGRRAGRAPCASSWGRTSRSWSTPTCAGRRTRRSAPPAPSRPPASSGSRSRRSRTTSPATSASLREGGLPVAAGENLHTLAEFEQLIAAGGVAVPRARRLELRRRDGLAQGRASRRGPRPAGHLPRRPRPPRPPAGRRAQRLVPGGPRLRARALPRPPARDARRAGESRPERPGHGVELDWKGLEPLRAD